MQAGLRMCCSQTPEDRFSRNKGPYYITVQRDYFSMVFATSLDTSHILIVLSIWVHVQVDKYKFLKIFATQTCKWVTLVKINNSFGCKIVNIFYPLLLV